MHFIFNFLSFLFGLFSIKFFLLACVQRVEQNREMLKTSFFVFTFFDLPSIWTYNMRGDIERCMNAINFMCKICALFTFRMHNFSYFSIFSFDIEKKSEVTGTKDSKEGRINITCHMAILWLFLLHFGLKLKRKLLDLEGLNGHVSQISFFHFQKCRLNNNYVHVIIPAMLFLFIMFIQPLFRASLRSICII